MTPGKQRILGIDYVVISGPGDREIYNGAHVKDSPYVHLGFGAFHTNAGQTACQASYDKFMVTYGDVQVDCPECVRIIEVRGEEA